MPVRSPVLLTALLALGFTARASADTNFVSEGGPVMITPRVHLIFWMPAGYHLRPDCAGGGDATDQQDIATTGQFVSDLGSSAWFHLANQYCADNGCPQSISLASSQVHTADYPHAGTIDDPLTQDDVSGAVTAVANIPRDSTSDGLSDIYAVLLPSGVVSVASNGKAYPGYHSVVYVANDLEFGIPVVYALVHPILGNPCSTNPSPNGLIADANIQTLGHELIEATTDPFPGTSPAWFDPTVALEQSELADRCEFVPANHEADGANLILPDGHRYVVPQIWSNGARDFSVDGSCQMSNPAATSVLPASGPNGGGTLVLVTGGVFSSGDEVRFDEIPASSSSCPGVSLCIARTPPHYAEGAEDGSPPNPLPATVPVNVVDGPYESADNAAPVSHQHYPIQFQYQAGPPCSARLRCPPREIGVPQNLEIHCREQVFFWDQNRVYLGEASSFTEQMGDPGDDVFACTCNLSAPPGKHRFCGRHGCCPPGPGSSCVHFNATRPPSQWCFVTPAR